MTHKTISLQAGIVLRNATGTLVDSLPDSHQNVFFYNKIIMAKCKGRLKIPGGNPSAIYLFNKLHIIGIKL